MSSRRSGTRKTVAALAAVAAPTEAVARVCRALERVAYLYKDDDAPR